MGAAAIHRSAPSHSTASKLSTTATELGVTMTRLWWLSSQLASASAASRTDLGSMCMCASARGPVSVVDVAGAIARSICRTALTQTDGRSIVGSQMASVVKVADVRRNEILDTAYALFVRLGYEATTVSLIIDELGLSKGAFYHHFSSKEEVLHALARRMVTEMRGQWLPLVARTDLTPLEKMQLLFGRGAQYKREHLPMVRAIGHLFVGEENLRLRTRMTAEGMRSWGRCSRASSTRAGGWQVRRRRPGGDRAAGAAPRHLLARRLRRRREARQERRRRRHRGAAAPHRRLRARAGADPGDCPSTRSASSSISKPWRCSSSGRTPDAHAHAAPSGR